MTTKSSECSVWETEHSPDATTASTYSEAHQGPSSRPIGELFQTWLGIKFDEIDALVVEAKSKVDAIPDQRRLWLIIGELVVRLSALELEVQELKTLAADDPMQALKRMAADDAQ